MAEVREIVERLRGCDTGRIEDIIALIPLLQGQLDPTSFIAGMVFGKSGGGLDSTAAMLLLTTATANSQVTATGAGVPTNSLNQILPLLLLMRSDWDKRGERSFEIVEKERTEPVRRRAGEPPWRKSDDTGEGAPT
jgi:hypothetical protein